MENKWFFGVIISAIVVPFWIKISSERLGFLNREKSNLKTPFTYAYAENKS